VDWLGARVKGYKIGGFAPCVGIAKKEIIHLKFNILIETNQIQRKMNIALLLILRIKIYRDDQDILTIFRPFYIGDDLLAVRRDKFYVGVTMKGCFAFSNMV